MLLLGWTMHVEHSDRLTQPAFPISRTTPGGALATAHVVLQVNPRGFLLTAVPPTAVAYKLATDTDTSKDVTVKLCATAAAASAASAITTTPVNCTRVNATATEQHGCGAEETPIVFSCPVLVDTPASVTFEAADASECCACQLSSASCWMLILL